MRYKLILKILILFQFEDESQCISFQDSFLFIVFIGYEKTKKNIHFLISFGNFTLKLPIFNQKKIISENQKTHHPTIVVIFKLFYKLLDIYGIE